MLGIFDRDFGGSLALAAGGTDAVAATTDPQTVQRALSWDLFNPWATICELNSTHPLPARRLRALQRQARGMGQVPTYDLPDKAAESYWDEFFVDLLMNYLPVIGLLGGMIGAAIGAALLGLGAGLFARTLFAYPKYGFTATRVADIVSEIKISKIRSIPAVLGPLLERGSGATGREWLHHAGLSPATGHS